ncbi:family 78 glycoside hydrolase catalytic domain [soil metagenome]
MRLRFLTASLALGLAISASATLKVSDLRVEYLNNPIGIDSTAPRSSWILGSDQRNQAQTAYRIRVSSTRGGNADLWDSGKVSSDATIQVVYAGKKLASRQQAYWTVQVWDQDRKPSTVSQPAKFEIGLLKPSDWKAQWIGMPSPAKPTLISSGAKWLWFNDPGDPIKDAPAGDRWFRKTFDLPGGKLTGDIAVAGDDNFEIWLNGKSVGKGASWTNFATFSLGALLVDGKNTLLVKVHNGGSRAGLLVTGQAVSGPTDPRMKRAVITIPLVSTDKWEASKDSTNWEPARELADIGAAPYGKTSLAEGATPSPIVRKYIAVGKTVKSARIYASARGLYELYIDDKKISKSLFTPGWTDYNKRIQYQTYDVTPQMKKGSHVVGMMLGDGWYCGNVAWAGRQNYGKRPMGLAQIEINYTDGTRQIIATDQSWGAKFGPIVSDDLLMGETYDARIERDEYGLVGSPDFKNALEAVEHDKAPRMGVVPEVAPIGSVPLVAQKSETCEVVTKVYPKSIKQIKPGTFIFDLGQNMVGHVQLKVKGPRGTKVTLRHAEMLNPDGTIYITNLRHAQATDNYILSGKGNEVWQPRFTFHGFRYVEVTGYPGTPTTADITGIVVSSATPETGTFSTSDKLINQLQHNIVWGMRSNYFEVPTDCPQRDERLGWMGDAQIFVKTATFNSDVAAFMGKWTQDVQDGQNAAGSFADVSPRIGVAVNAAPAWGDAGVIVPWTLFQIYGDDRLLRQRYDSMKKWVEYIDKQNPNHLWENGRSNDYGDWLNVNDNTPGEVIGTAYFAHSAKIVAESAAYLGKTADANEFNELTNEITEAFGEKFVSEDGHIKGDSQSAYVVALKFGLVPSQHRDAAVARLVELIKARGNHLSTGFLGCGYLNEVLSEYGQTDTAYTLLMNKDYPSWLYPIMNGATTIWERWDGWTKEKGFQDPGMNSFNHYSFGAIGSWMYKTVAGLGYEDLTHYKVLRVEPKMGGGLKSASATYHSIRGDVKVSWKLTDGEFRMLVVVPPNCHANVALPVGTLANTQETGNAVEQGKRGILSVDEDANRCVLSSGSYSFVTKLK